MSPGRILRSVDSKSYHRHLRHSCPRCRNRPRRARRYRHRRRIREPHHHRPLAEAARAHARADQPHAMSAPRDHGAYVRPAPRPHEGKAVTRLSTWNSYRPSGLWSRVSLISPASILSERVRGDVVVNDRCVTVHWPQTPPTRRLSRSAVSTVDLSADQSGIAMTWMMASRETDSSQDRLPQSLQVALAAASQDRQVRRRWEHLGCPF